ncbi:MAG: exosortase J [Acidobacteriota bacterium]
MNSSILSSNPAPPQGAQGAADGSRKPGAPPIASAPGPRIRACIVGLALLGCLGMASILLQLWDIWTDDPLKSIGMLIVPVSVILTLRIWRQAAWELKGHWAGLPLVLLGLGMSAFRFFFESRVLAGRVTLNLLSPKIGLYLFGSGFVLLFAGTRVWKRAWFPLALLLCAQPVPYFFLVYGDLPLQNFSAHIARSFAVLIGFPPTSQEMLRLMFTPDFGMFIAPGCDGVRGALTMGYLALITGYLKKVSLPRWIAYTLGGVLLGYVFNLIRLCALVLYYRIAVGHPGMEHFAKWADYIIGGCLFLVATVTFLWIASRNDEASESSANHLPVPAPWSPRERRMFPWRAAAFAAMAALFALPGLHAIRTYQKSFFAKVRDGIIQPDQLDNLMPQRLGTYTRNRAWQEQVDGRTDIETAAYDRPQQDEAVIGVWLPEWAHNMHGSWMARGEDPLQRHEETFLTARGPAAFDTAYYSNGTTDSIAGNAFCSPTSCVSSPDNVDEGVNLVIDPPDFRTPGQHVISIFFRIDRPHTAEDQAAVFRRLDEEAKAFVSGVDFGEISRRFQ